MSHDSEELRPVPPEGTPAPSRPDRVFGSSRGSRGASPPERHSTAAAPGADGTQSGIASPSDGGRSPGRSGEDERRKIILRGRLALILGIVALAASIPLFPLGVPLGITAIVLGLVSGRQGRRARMVVVPGAVSGLIVGTVATLIAGAVTAIVVLFFDELSEYQRCLSAANTRSGEQICQETLQDRVMERLSG